MLEGEDSAGAQILQSLDIDPEQMQKELKQVSDTVGETAAPPAEVKGRKGQGEENLSKYGRDITQKALSLIHISAMDFSCMRRS